MYVMEEGGYFQIKPCTMEEYAHCRLLGWFEEYDYQTDRVELKRPIMVALMQNLDNWDFINGAPR
jgi:hypothetical protein